jgi:cytochrome c553
MKRAFSPLRTSVFAALLIMSTGPAVAADAARGETLYINGDAARNITACIACHGAEGNSTITQNPKLAGQYAAYITKQMMDFRTPARNSPIMSALAKSLSDDDIKDIAAYMDSRVTKLGTARGDEASRNLGRDIYRAGIAAKGVPACAACHSPTGKGIPAQYPRLSGQHQDYTVTELVNFRGGTRKNSAPMTAVAERLSDKEIKAVADYIAGLR